MVVIACSILKLEEEDVTIDPILSKVAHIHKYIGDQVYECYVDVASLNHTNNGLQCFPDSPPDMDARRYPIPDDWQPRTTRSISINEYTEWTMPCSDFDTLEWLGPRLPMKSDYVSLINGRTWTEHHQWLESRDMYN